MTNHMPRMNARRVTQEEALAQIKSNHEKGYALTMWYKDATGYRAGVLCSCCSCCCFGTEVERMARKIPGLRPLKITAPSGYSAVTDMEKCTADGECVSCPYEAREIVETAEGRRLEFHYDLCMGCAACVSKCPEGAITMVRDENKGIPLDMEELMAQAKGEPVAQKVAPEMTH
ncbi:4Fe-4S binding protein [Thermodesulfobacteriota bacterium]